MHSCGQQPSRMRDLDEVIAKRLSSSWGRQIQTSSPSNKGKLRKMLEPDAPYWSDVADYCKKNPGEVVQLDSRSRTCLSTACAKNPPVEVVRAMMEVCKFGVEATCDKTGLTALTIAIKTHASLDVVRELSRSTRMVETRDHRANTPLHLVFLNRYQHGVTNVCEMLLATNPNLASMNNYDGKTPLHIAIETRASTAAVRILLEASPKAAMSQTCGYTSLTAAIQFNASLDVYRLLVNACPEVTRIQDESGRLPLRCALEHRFNDANIIKLLCDSKEAVLDSDHIGRNTLHISLDRLVPNSQIVELLLKQAPEACEQKAKSGELPIHVAYHRYAQAIRHVEARPHSLSAQRDCLQWWKVVEMVVIGTMNHLNFPSVLHASLSTGAPIEVVSKLANIFPEAVSEVDRKGNYPIMIAAQMSPSSCKDAILNLLLDREPGLAVHLDESRRSVLSVVSERLGVSETTMYRLICACPDAVRCIDPICNLYPFMIAAAQPSDRNQQRDVQQLGSIFELLLAAPDLVGV
mmetsp:Transcript_995/g.1818  ORF Transcript_995/g.1818 Transcript_995/m.1818 type:complete len:522 (-) Transcript_995:111-1676(-)